MGQTFIDNKTKVILQLVTVTDCDCSPVWNVKTDKKKIVNTIKNY